MKKKIISFALLILMGLAGLFVLGFATSTNAQGVDIASAVQAPVIPSFSEDMKAVTKTEATTCTISYDKTASPAEVDAGGVTTVTLSLQATGACDAASSPVDVMLVLDRSASM